MYDWVTLCTAETDRTLKINYKKTLKNFKKSICKELGAQQ